MLNAIAARFTADLKAKSIPIDYILRSLRTDLSVTLWSRVAGLGVGFFFVIWPGNIIQWKISTMDFSHAMPYSASDSVAALNCRFQADSTIATDFDPSQAYAWFKLPFTPI